MKFKENCKKQYGLNVRYNIATKYFAGKTEYELSQYSKIFFAYFLISINK